MTSVRRRSHNAHRGLPEGGRVIRVSARLSSRERKVLRLADHTYVTAAQKLGTTQPAFKTVWSRIRRKAAGLGVYPASDRVGGAS